MSETARDPSSLQEILAELENDGFAVAMSPREGGDVCCDNCGQSSPAEDFAIDAIRRLEGASDPADMAAVVALTCPRCSAKGALTLTYGPSASGADSDVLSALPTEGTTQR